MKKNKLIKKEFLIIIIFFIEIFFVYNVSAQLDEKGTWTLKSSIQTPRIGHGVVSCNGKIYVIGGYNDSGFLDLVEVYDPVNDLWENKTSMPYSVAEFGICSVGNDIYVIGGCNELMKKGDSIYPSNILNNVLVYDTLSDSWSQKTPMPTARNSLALGVVDDRIYAIGGAELLWNDCCYYLYKALNKNEVYYVENDTWESLPALPTPRHHIGLAVLNDEIFVCGGNTGADLWPSNNKLEIFSTSTKTWRTGKSLPKNLTVFGISTVDNNIYIIGGICYPEYYVNDVFHYDLLNNEWSNMTSIIEPRFGLGACNLNEKIYAIGGAVDGLRSIYTATNLSNKNEEFTIPIVNIKPDVEILFPTENLVVSGLVNISGTASATNTTLLYIQIKINYSSWININPIDMWNYTLDTTIYSNGNYIISARSFDGESYSLTETVNITIENYEKENKNLPGFEIIIVFCAFLFIFFWKKIKS